MIVLACTALAPAASAQTRPAVSQPVVQSLPNRSSLTLNQALARLGQNPRDIEALIDAGNAALSMGDVDAAVGFFRRADQISPGNGRVKAGLAGALVHSENPYDAIPMFDEAERAGALDDALAGERGLAYDLVGDNDKAQRYYRLALSRDFNDEITRRLALSYAIGGDRRSAETTLTPLLQKQDKAAWRTRAFALAILGQVDEAVSIANTSLPPALSAGISPYLRYMPRLTPAQQAAAANLGHFPRASEIGRDDPRVALYAPKTPRRNAQHASADAALTPRGKPLGRKDGARDSRRDSSSRDSRSRGDTALAANTAARQAMVRPPSSLSTAGLGGSKGAVAELPGLRPATPAPTRTAAASPPTPPATAPRPAPVTAPRPAPAASSIVLPPTTPSPATAPVPPMPSVSSSPAPALAAATVPGPSLSISAPAVQGPPAGVQDAPAPAAAPMPDPAPAAPVAAPARPVSLADAFSDLLSPPKIDIAPAPGAVDVRRLAPSRQTTEAKPGQAGKPAQGKAAAPKPPAPSHPSRIWVQIATGRDKAALAFDWRRLLRENAQALRGKQAFTSSWGQTNRLLTGPFPTTAAANAFMTQIRRAGIEGSFLWTSPAGQVVDTIAGK